MPRVREGGTVDGRHDEDHIANHDDADGGEGSVAVGFRGEDLEAET